jgi:hypothetical protein
VKLRDVAKGSWAIRPVKLRLVNTSQAAQPGQPPSGEPVEITLGVRLLTGEETEQVYQKAQADAASLGVATWIDDHPICRSAQMVRTLELALIDLDSDPKKPEPFASAEELRTSLLIGTDNIAYLFERWTDFVDECSIEAKNLTPEQVLGVIAVEAERPENSESPFVHMRPGLRASCTRSMAVMLWTLLTAKSPSGSSGDTNTGSDANVPKSDS